MSVIRRRLRLVEEPPKPKPTEVPARPWLPDGMSSAEYTFREAIQNYRKASTPGATPVMRREQERAGLVNVAHAWLWAVTDTRLMSKEDAQRLFRELTDVAGVWEVG